jgi:hypothetical protein
MARSKDKMFSIRIPDKLIDDFRKMCDENSWMMSKRLRKLMEADITRWVKYKMELEKRDEKKEG